MKKRLLASLMALCLIGGPAAHGGAGGGGAAGSTGGDACLRAGPDCCSRWLHRLDP